MTKDAATTPTTSRRPEARREALSWLAGRLRWERSLESLRAHPGSRHAKAA